MKSYTRDEFEAQLKKDQLLCRPEDWSDMEKRLRATFDQQLESEQMAVKRIQNKFREEIKLQVSEGPFIEAKIEAACNLLARIFDMKNTWSFKNTDHGLDEIEKYLSTEWDKIPPLKNPRIRQALLKTATQHLSHGIDCELFMERAAVILPPKTQ